MKKNQLLIFICFICSTFIWSSCVTPEEDVSVSDCGNETLKVVRQARDGICGQNEKYYNYYFTTDQYILRNNVTITITYDSIYKQIEQADSEPFRKEQKISLSAGQSHPISKNSDGWITSPKIFKSGSFCISDQGCAPFHCLYTINLISVEITPEDCDQPLKKDENDIATDSEALDTETCDENLALDIQITTCDPTVISWTAAENLDLSDATLSLFGKEIGLSNGNTISFPKAELDFSLEEENPVTGGNVCTVNYTTISCGTTGILTLTDPIEAEQDFIVTLEDADLADGGNFDLTVTTSLGESESITMVESDTETGKFSATLSTILSNEAGTNNDGSINIENGVTISVSYDDEYDSEAKDPDPITKTVTVTGESFPTGTEITYAGATYYLNYGSYIDFTSLDGSLVFNLIGNESSPEVYLDVTIGSSTTITSETYTIGETDYYIITDASGISIDNDPNGGQPFTSGSVALTIGNTSYTLVMNLVTAEGNLTGTFEVPFE